MSKLKAALLEDSPTLLEDLKMEVEDTGLVQVVAWATRSEDFLEKVRTARPDILLLDIDLNGDGMSGLDVAAKLKLPVLFVSGKMAEYYEGVSVIDGQLKDVPVMFITKPVNADKLNAILPKFIHQVRASAKPAEVRLTLQSEGKKTFFLKDIVCLCSEKSHGASSNNKEIHFTNRPPGVLIDFSFSGMDEMGFPADGFLTIHKSFRVNVAHLNALEGDVIHVRVCDANGKIVDKELSVSENYLPTIRKHFK
ncbi:MAG: response regulator [Flavobacteriales bacterium]|nr:response regulator [Flavobacteriales bacterium]